jgi:hypothetical protein
MEGTGGGGPVGIEVGIGGGARPIGGMPCGPAGATGDIAYCCCCC